MIFGFAVNLDVDSARIAWMDEDRTPQSRALYAELEGSGRFLVTQLPKSEKEMQGLLDRSQVDGVVRVLPGFARDIERGRSTSVQILVDGTNSNTATIISAYASQAVSRYATVAMVTDFDCWHPDHDHVTVEAVVQVLFGNADKARNLVKTLVPELGTARAPCAQGCGHALDNALITAPEKRSAALAKKLDAVAGRVLNPAR